MSALNSNATSIAGEFAVLSRLALEGFDANMTLGKTKSVDILVSSRHTGRMAKLEVKTNLGKGQRGGSRALFGEYIFAWMMSDKHEKIALPDLFYCFVNIALNKRDVRCFILPSDVVASYVTRQHDLWLQKTGRVRGENDRGVRIFRIGTKAEFHTYQIVTPMIEDFEDKWTRLEGSS